MDLEKEVIEYAASKGMTYMIPEVDPRQVLGLEINEYAVEITRTVVWIGYLQWRVTNGFGVGDPVLQPLETIREQDALLDLSDSDHPKEATWPAADFIVGNPPFLGDKKMRAELGTTYLQSLWSVYRATIPQGSDLICYFLEKARRQIENDSAERAGLLTTNSVRGGANRVALDRIKQTGDIFLAWSDQPWILDGAAVRISIVAFDNGCESQKCLDGVVVPQIHSNLTSSVDITAAHPLVENRSLAFLGIQKGGPFDVPYATAKEWLDQPLNPNGLSNREVVKKRLNGYDIMRRSQNNWIVDFGSSMSSEHACQFEMPFEHVLKQVKPLRDINPRRNYRENWWLHTEPRPGLRAKLDGLDRFICTPTVSKHRAVCLGRQQRCTGSSTHCLPAER